MSNDKLAQETTLGGTYVSIEWLKRVEAERNAAVKDLTMVGSCRTCGNRTPWCDDNPDSCRGYIWRGLADGSSHV